MRQHQFDPLSWSYDYYGNQFVARASHVDMNVKKYPNLLYPWAVVVAIKKMMVDLAQVRPEGTA